jgi:hypothetical protein
MTLLLPLILVSIPGIFNQRLLSHPARIQAWTFRTTLCRNLAPSLIHHPVRIPIMRTPNLFISCRLLLHPRLLRRTHLGPILQSFGIPGPQSVTRTIHANIQIPLSALSHLQRFNTLLQTRGSHVPVMSSIVLNAVRHSSPNRRRTTWKYRVQSVHQLLRTLRMGFPVHLCHR